MRIWYLMCGLTQEYAVAFANSEEEAFEKLKSQRKNTTNGNKLGIQFVKRKDGN